MSVNRLALIKQSLSEAANAVQARVDPHAFLGNYIESGIKEGNIVPRVQAMIDSNRYSISNINPHYKRGSEYVMVNPRDGGNVNVITMDELQQLIQGLQQNTLQ